MKALLIHTAISSLPSRAPTYAFGWGALDALGAATLLGDSPESMQLMTVTSDKAWSRKMRWTSAESARFTLVWIDRPGPASDVRTTSVDDTSRKLVNDLDLIVKSPSGETHYPWSLDRASPTAPATNLKENRIDTVEVIDLPFAIRSNPDNADGEWTVRIRLSEGVDSAVTAVLVTSAMQEETPP